MGPEIYPIALTLILLSLLFMAGWYNCFQKKIFAWLDFYWSSSFLVVILVKQFVSYRYSNELNLHLIDILYILWAVRLSSHLFFRIRKNGEDKRYVELKRKWKVWYGLNFFLLFQLEAIITLLLSIPILIAHPLTLGWPHYLGLGIFAIAFSGETIADMQLTKFVSDDSNTKKVCNIGLWRYSRHPNYFFEWLIWVSFAIYSLGSSHGWVGSIPAFIMFFVLTKFTGIPPAERSSLASKQEAYAKYQRQTNAFFPWFPKKTSLGILIIFLSLNTNAHEVSMEKQQEKIKFYFNNLRADNMEILHDFYAQEVSFVDPIGNHNGIESVKEYYRKLYKNVNSIEFKFKEIISNSNHHSAYWTMTLSAQGLKNGEPITLEGNSLIKFNDSGFVTYHRDYFDMGEFIYENIPVMGWIVKKVKNQLRGEK